MQKHLDHASPEVTYCCGAAATASAKGPKPQCLSARHLPPEEQPSSCALQGGAIAFGVLIGGSGTLILHDLIGWAATLWTVAAITLISITPFLATSRSTCPLPPARG